MRTLFRKVFKSAEAMSYFLYDDKMTGHNEDLY